MGAISIEERLDGLESRVEEVLQLVERLIDHVLPKDSYCDGYKVENTQALVDGPEVRDA